MAPVSQHLLHLGGGFDAAWHHVAKPWFERAAGEAWRSGRPWVVLVPTHAFASLLKQNLLAGRIPLAAVRFWVPGDAREFLAARLPDPPRLAVREHLHLLLALVASGRDDSPTVRAIARDPSRLLRTLDALASAGAPLPADLPPEAAEVAGACFARVRELGWTTVQQLDWRLLQEMAGPRPAPVASLLVIGFDGMHWELWPLLNAVVRSAETADVVLNQPRYKAEQIDQIWIGSWEQQFGALLPLPDDAPSGAAVPAGRPFAPLAEKMENPQGEVAGEIRRARVLTGRNLREEAEAVVALAGTWLAREDVGRLGILVPAAGPLAREISALLLERGIVHYDAIGHAAPPDDRLGRWRAWIELQREQKLGPLLDVLRDAGPSVADAFESAYGELLTDDLAVIAAWLRESRREEHREAARQLDGVALLPGSAALGEFIDAARAAAAGLAPPDIASVLLGQAEAVAGLRAERMSRSLFLDWLASATDAPVRARDPRATNPFAVVQLLPSAHAEGLPWSHLILADLNEGHWPPAFDQPGFLHDEDIAAINREAVETGSQGEGHLSVKPRRALLLGPNERRALARRQFYNLVEAPAVSLAVAAALEDLEESRGLGPSDFLSHLCFTQTGEPLSESRAAELQAATQDWLGAAAGRNPGAGGPAAVGPAVRTRAAFDARRAEGIPFGPYEFALPAPPAEPLVIACKEWESALASPASVFLARLLGVAAKSDFLAEDRWPLTAGTWVHAWLSSGMGARHPEKLVRRPEAAALVAGTRSAARNTRARAEHAFAAARRPLPDWWQSRWAGALWMTGELAVRVGQVEDWPWAATEWKLPKPTEIRIGEDVLRVRGRMDLVLSPDETFAPGSRLWLFDFKTGADKPLRPKDLLKKFAKGGGGLQLALYALALRALGAGEVAITLLTPGTAAAPQLSSADVESLAGFWRGLARMQDTGLFGMRGELRSEFSHTAAMPIATLPVSADLLEEKWALTHPLLTAKDP